MSKFTRGRRISLVPPLILVGLISLLMAATGGNVLAQSAEAIIRWVRTVEADDAAVTHPVGMAYSTRVDAFYVVDIGAQDRSASTGGANNTTIVELTAHGQKVKTISVAASVADPINMAYDSRFSRLLMFDSAHNELIAVADGADGHLDPTKLTRYSVEHFGVQSAQGIAVDPELGTLYLLDAEFPRLVRVVPAANGGFAGATMTVVDLSATALSEPRGVAYDPATGYLHIVDVSDQKLYELTTTGTVIAVRDLAEFNLAQIGGALFAPSGDLTDDPNKLHLYVADSGLNSPLAGIQSGATAARGEAAGQESPQDVHLDHHIFLPIFSDKAEHDADDDPRRDVPGQIVEFSFTAQAEPQALPEAFTPVLIRTIDASLWSPPSPDTSGIVYLPASNSLMVSDGEVNETVTKIQSGVSVDLTLYQDVNMWRITLAGTVIDTWTSVPNFSDEPTGLALNPTNNHLFVSDDTGTRGVYEVDPGGDGLYGTTDDVVTFFRTSSFNSMDPEDLVYVEALSALFIVDGTNEEVYRVSPGPNGVFDGAAAPGDDLVTSFDTEILGIPDLEGIGYNPDTGNLYLVGSLDDFVFEVTITGELVQIFDIAHLRATSLAGITVAPSSQDPSVKSAYIVDRGVDNDTPVDRLPNDGKVYEISLPPVPNAPPTVGPITVAPASPKPVGTTIKVQANFTDPDTTDTHTCTINWGDATADSAGTVKSQQCSGTHSYSDAGVYTVEITVTDNHDATGTATYRYVVAYDPDAGFVTGGGWLNTQDGSAIYGFAVKYLRRATSPSGTMLYLSRDVDLLGYSLDWLVIVGDKAVFQGTSWVNGHDNRGYMVTIVDKGEPGRRNDTFRIKIWDKDNGNTVIYDTEPGLPDGAAPGATIAGGNIQVHGARLAAESTETVIIGNPPQELLESLGIPANTTQQQIFLPVIK